VEYDAARGTFRLPAEQAAALAGEGGRAFLAGAFQAAAGLGAMADDLAQAFRAGAGLDPRSFPADVARGMARTTAARYDARTLRAWIGALPDVAARLENGGSAADLGCGEGGATRALAEAWPRSRVTGFDLDAGAVAAAAAAGGAAGFAVAGGLDFPGEDYDLVCCFESFHEMARPLDVARHVRSALRADGAWLLVEPYAADRLEDNAGAWGRLVSSAAALHCLPIALAQGGGALGPLAGLARLTGVLEEAGLARISRLTSDSYQFVLAARP
jgi:SAM-dependent methyltransferase